MELNADQQAKAKVLFEYEEAKKALARCRDEIQFSGKALIAVGEAVLNHPATMVFNGRQNGGECLGASGEQKSGGEGICPDSVAKSPPHVSPHSPETHPATNGVHHAHPKSAQHGEADESTPHCDTRYLNAERLARLVTEFRELSQRVVELEQQKKHMGYFN